MHIRWVTHRVHEGAEQLTAVLPTHAAAELSEQLVDAIDDRRGVLLRRCPFGVLAIMPRVPTEHHGEVGVEIREQVRRARQDRGVHVREAIGADGEEYGVRRGKRSQKRG